jgi:energy-coupling factor transporter ATP-binding protein EcfA2
MTPSNTQTVCEPPSSDSILSDAAKSIDAGRWNFINGENFSGRSRFLAGLGNKTGIEATNSIRLESAYVPPELSLSVSGLRPTVESEILLHLKSTTISAPIAGLLKLTGLDCLLHRNPTTLSGGELAMLVLICKLALRPSVLALDCSLEQIAPEMKGAIVDHVTGNEDFPSNIFIADNRVAELRHHCRSTFNSVDLPSGCADDITRFAPLESNFSPVPAQRAPVIELENVSFSYQRAPLLKRLSMTLQPGAAYVLEGRNGAGKTTLAKILCGVLRPSGGAIRIDGCQIDLYKTPGRIANHVNQDPDVQFVADTVWADFGLSAATDTRQPVEKRVTDALRVLGLTKVKSDEISDLPFVGRKRASFGGPLTALPPWMIFDEPTLAQDDKTVGAFATLMCGLAHAGFGVIVITHSEYLRNQLDAVRLKLADGALTRDGETSLQ